jgi:hypothetical protein
MLPANINITNSIPDWENKLRASLEQAGFNDPEKQGKIIGDIANELQKKGTTKPIERDIFEAASEVYEFNNKTNLRLAKAIDGLDGKTNIQLSESNAEWTGTGAVINKDEREQPNDSLNMVRSSIEKIKKTDPKFTVDDIIQDLKDRNIILVDGQKVTSNKHLHDNLVAMREQGFTGKDIEEATKNDADWRNLLGTVKKTEFQRQLIQDSIKQIKKTDFTVDDQQKFLKKK